MFRKKPEISVATLHTNNNTYKPPESPNAARNHRFTTVEGGNGSGTAYQEANGAPVENISVLGHHVGWATIIFLNINAMVGTGIFSIPGNLLRTTGSVGLALIYWTIGAIMALAGFSTYLELASYFPNRSGSEVVYLEQAYPRPRYFFPIAFAVQSVIMSFNSGNVIIMSRYIWRIVGRLPSDWEMKGVAIACFSVAVIFVVSHNKYSLWIINGLGVLKLLTLLFISICGFVVLGGHVSRVPNPGINFQYAFDGTTKNANDLSSSLVSMAFAYAGYQNAFNMVNEIQNPVKSIKRYGFASVLIVAVLYLLCNIAYFSAVDTEAFRKSKEVAASIFFTTVFGPGPAETILNVLVTLSAFGNLLVSLIGQSRIIREVGRQGVLPYTDFWVSTKPFGTPIGPYLLQLFTTTIIIIAPPAGDAFQFMVSLPTYTGSIFALAISIGLWVIRARRKRGNLPKSEFRVWNLLLLFFILINIMLLAMPWWPPKGGPYAGDVSFWYATYCAVGLAIISLCCLYYVVWMYVLPKWKRYQIRAEVVRTEGDIVLSHRLVKVPIKEIDVWDAEHDEKGERRY